MPTGFSYIGPLSGGKKISIRKSSRVHRVPKAIEHRAAAIKKKIGDASSSYAIAVAQSQKEGRLHKGTMKLTKKGLGWEALHRKESEISLVSEALDGLNGVDKEAGVVGDVVRRAVLPAVITASAFSPTSAQAGSRNKAIDMVRAQAGNRGKVVQTMKSSNPLVPPAVLSSWSPGRRQKYFGSLDRNQLKKLRNTITSRSK